MELVLWWTGRCRELVDAEDDAEGAGGGERGR